MKVNIRTVFKTENCGSFLQAWALKEQLVGMDNEVVFSDYKSPIVVKNKYIAILKCCLKLKFRRAKSILKKSSSFKKYQKKLQIEKGKNEADIYFFGSDTLWNFDDSFFAKNDSFFTGEDVEKPCYTYSMSIGSTLKETLLKHKKAIENIQKFKGLAVRDKHTEQVLSEIYSGSVVRTVDPTMLIEKENYVEHFCKRKTTAKKTLVLYYFGAMPKKLQDEIVAFARKRDLEIVYIGRYEKGYDRCVVGIPENFITEFFNAEYIFTNTFHGCVFSTLFNKQFATNGTAKKKVQGFLDEFALTDRALSNDCCLEKVLTNPVDYEKVNELINEGRERSINYLKNALEEVKHE